MKYFPKIQTTNTILVQFVKIQQIETTLLQIANIDFNILIYGNDLLICIWIYYI